MANRRRNVVGVMAGVLLALSGHGIGHWVASDDGSVFALRDAPS